jgi:hypothetical protein
MASASLPLSLSSLPQHQARTYVFRMPRSSNFTALAAQLAASMLVPEEQLVLFTSFASSLSGDGGRRLFASATPASLGMWTEGEIDVGERETWEYLRDVKAQEKEEQKERARSRSRSLSVQPEDEDGRDRSEDGDDDEIEFSGGTNAYSGAGAAAAASPPRDTTPAADGKFKLVIRSGITTKDISIAVRPTTTCGAIIKGFVKAALMHDASLGPKLGLKLGGKPADMEKGMEKILKKARLVMDGERMDNDAEIGDADLEDGDMVEVSGL